MTNQRDPNMRRRPDDYLRRDDGSWSVLPMLLVLALILGAGYLVYSNYGPAGSTATRTTETTRTLTPPATSPSTPPAPTMPPKN